MKFQAAVLALVASLSVAEASRVLKAKNVVPSAAFEDIPELEEKDRRARARLQRRLAKVAVPTERRAADAYDENNYNFGDYSDWWDNEMVVEEFGFDIDNYSLKYTGCHTKNGYSEDIAENENYQTVLGSETYVTFRLCLTEMCSDGGDYLYGCSNNYGEYMVSLDEYVTALTAYRDDKRYNFCSYCETCAAMKGYTSWVSQMRTSMSGVAESFQYAMESFIEAQQYNANNGGDADDQGMSDEEWEIEYYNYVSQNVQNDQNYQGDYGAGQSMSTNVNKISQQWWDYAKADSYMNNGNYQNSLASSFQQGGWYSLNSQYPTFCQQPVMPGYFDEGGDWVSSVGYWNKDQGVYVHFVDDGSGIGGIPWDSNCWGDMPFGWDNVQGQDPNYMVQCDTGYSSQCSAGYDDCMYKLHYEDLLEMEFGEGYEYSNQQAAQSNTASMFKYQLLQEEFTQYLQCQATDYMPAQSDMQQSDYANQNNYQQLYKLKSNYMNALAQCEDQSCEEALEAKMESDLTYQNWIIESAWELYETYKNANQAYYVGATCMDNGFDIGLKVFHDEACLYPNDEVSAGTVVGNSALNKIHLDAVTKQCIPCRDEQYYLNMDMQDGAQEENLQDEDANGVLSYCSMLYQISAKCNANLKPNHIYNGEGYYIDGIFYAPEFDQMYMSEQQEDQEKKVCGLIESLNSGTYKEDGSIYLGGLGWITGSRLRNEISSATAAMSGGVKALVFLLAIGAFGMGLWAMVLHGAIKRKMAPWQPKDPVDLARAESGIVMGRSRSGPATNPLI
mmetsp:Transcript_10835/g.29987  ORF Transcript_10835/g.29987 Transcript_10835/m.29987 type:complete len:786 (-) Transcript_10835:199-2556(-)|eukprot:CAMPEP_0168741298 /NCGR_PEP_ID=MMETSP0724-20121128/12435_1 /TAXON_ID=265536 /ORGANISM="Amphiprora sp., Strain CCMP467" /LENGTH=785 /DNA_ID=CAMNT_0008788785 /DNA_START=5 /DNA_END=2362 /DNA_ORIENTATION=-